MILLIILLCTSTIILLKIFNATNFQIKFILIIIIIITNQNLIKI